MKTKHLILASLLLLIGFSSCKKLPEHIGDSLQPNSSNIHVAFSGNQNITAAVEHIDSLSTKSASLSLLGDLNDPHFGNSNLSFYTQIGLTSNSLQWGEGAVTDSIMMQMVYSGYYGDTLTPLTIKIHEVVQDMGGESTTYYSNTTFEIGEELANYTFSPRPSTKIKADNDTLGTYLLQFHVNKELGDRFMSEAASVFSSNSNFMDYFKGLHFSCEPANGTGSICYFNVLNSKTFLRVYYHNDYDTTFYDFNISDKYIRFNHFEHDYTTAQAPITFNNNTENPYLYVQSTAGVRTRLSFPNIGQWANSLNTNVLVNEAKLILTGAKGLVNDVENDTSMFNQPVQLVAVKAKADGSYEILPDQLVGTSYFGGYYDKNTDQIWFRISEYIQDLIIDAKRAEADSSLRKEDYGLFIYTYAGAYNAKRWIFNGPDNTDTTNRIRLELIYSQIDD
ncbi:MAG: DUF4270 domain-containing protein [Bacteroidales bacterium]|nr:DUF4270 domain-containing protein [Bacteroidales bacterium]